MNINPTSRFRMLRVPNSPESESSTSLHISYVLVILVERDMASVGDKRGSDGASKTVVIAESMMEISEAQLYDYYRQSLSSQGFKVPEYGGLIPGGIGPYRMYNEEQGDF
ncbi:uncharacterized protein LOC107608347 [Arachis ipaensis]|uniref:uncharacterized protein LOC107608347 n=1 Tax=Arachis ipaensis TaxID=130454 RepID=UPI000A2B2DB2|nr:uncharacterized protein LOC107608347 [Arachis ipaensis]